MDESLPEPGSPRHLAWLYADAADRPRLAALFAVEREIMQSTRPGIDHGVAHARLAWWEEECERLAAALPRHPQTVALLRESRRAGAAAPDLSALVRAARWDLAQAAPETRDDLIRRCTDWSAGVFRHVGPPAAAQWLTDTGAVLEEWSLTTTAHTEARRGRLRLPLAELAALAVPPQALDTEPYPPALAEHLAARHRELGDRMQARLALLAAPVVPGLRAALVWIELAAIDARRAAQALPGLRAAGRFDAVRDTWRAWRTARRAQQGRTPSLSSH